MKLKIIVKKQNQKAIKKKHEKEIVNNNLYKFYEGKETVLNGFRSGIFLTKSQGSGLLNIVHSKLKILTPKQILQRLPIALAQVNVYEF